MTIPSRETTCMFVLQGICRSGSPSCICGLLSTWRLYGLCETQGTHVAATVDGLANLKSHRLVRCRHNGSWRLRLPTCRTWPTEGHPEVFCDRKTRAATLACSVSSGEQHGARSIRQTEDRSAQDRPTEDGAAQGRALQEDSRAHEGRSRAHDSHWITAGNRRG